MLEVRQISQPEELWLIFEQELKDHLISISEILKYDPLSEEQDRILSHRFHRLKGSLGFIGFQDLFDEITSIEKLFKNKNQEFRNKSEIIISDLQILLNDITDKLQKC